GERWRSGCVADPCSAARDLARFVVALRRLDASDGPRNPRGDRGWPLATRDAWVERSITALGREIDPRAGRAEWETALAGPVWAGPPVWFHGDLFDNNLLLANGRLAAVLDFGIAGVGDPACDQVPAWALFSGASREAFRRELGGDDASWARARGWALSQA